MTLLQGECFLIFFGQAFKFLIASTWRRGERLQVWLMEAFCRVKAWFGASSEEAEFHQKFLWIQPLTIVFHQRACPARAPENSGPHALQLEVA